jgi:23S rRNA (uracil1939-C5)-methyltransferase
VGVRASATGETLITLVATAAEGPWPVLAAALSARLPDLRGLTVDVNPGAGNAVFAGAERAVWGAPDLAETYGPVTVRLTGAGFGQVNRGQADALYADAARVALAPLPGGALPARIWDLFSGAGALALTVAQAAGPGGPTLLGIERDVAAVARARLAAAAQGLEGRCAFAAGDANAALADAVAAPDVVILNPPRTGCRAGLLAALVPARVRRVIYVSCAPATLARDLAALLAAGYRLAAVTPYDMLPQTPHLEVLAVLEAG